MRGAGWRLVDTQLNGMEAMKGHFAKLFPIDSHPIWRQNEMKCESSFPAAEEKRNPKCSCLTQPTMTLLVTKI